MIKGAYDIVSRLSNTGDREGTHRNPPMIPRGRRLWTDLNLNMFFVLVRFCTMTGLGL